MECKIAVGLFECMWYGWSSDRLPFRQELEVLKFFGYWCVLLIIVFLGLIGDLYRSD